MNVDILETLGLAAGWEKLEDLETEKNPNKGFYSLVAKKNYKKYLKANGYSEVGYVRVEKVDTDSPIKTLPVAKKIDIATGEEVAFDPGEALRDTKMAFNDEPLYKYTPPNKRF